MASKESIELYTELHRLGRQLFRVSHREWHEHGHYRGQYRLLRLIMENDGVMQRDLAEEMDMRPSSMTELLARMEQMGLVRREPDEKDQRVVRVSLTDAGRAMAEEATGATDDLVGEMFKGMTGEEVASMLALTRKLGDNLDAMVPPYGPRGGRFDPRRGNGDGMGYGGGRGFRHHGPWGSRRFD
jgi:DNA-binding MarR family transcriptional regulator